MFRDVNILKLLPDRPGRGGTKFGYHSWQQEPINDTRQTLNVHVWQDSWRSDYTGHTGQGIFPDDDMRDPGTESALVVHGYNKYSLTDPTAGPSVHILGHNKSYRGGVPTGYVWDYTNYTYYYVDVGLVFSSNKVCNASFTHPAILVNVNNRCFIATGEGEGQIYDVSTGPTIAWASGPVPQVYTIGVDAPTVAPIIEAAAVKNYSEAYLHDTSIYVSHPDVNSSLSNAAAGANPALNYYEVEGDGFSWTGGDEVNIKTKTTTFSTAGMTVSIDNGSNIATFSPGASIPANNGWTGLRLTVNGFDFTMMEFGNATPSPSVTLAADQCLLATYYQNGRLHPPGSGDPIWDPAKNIEDATFAVTGVRWTMTNGGADVAWPGGLSGDATVVGTLIGTGGMLTWDTTPPSYAYAWYDPLTGHISNISPIFSTTETSKTNVGISISVDTGDISYPPSTSSIPTYDGSPRPSRWTHILFFRTLMAGGSTLYPIGSLLPTIEDPNTPGTYTDNPDWMGLPKKSGDTFPPTTTGNTWTDTARDASLLVSGALRAPQFTNGKPKIIQNGTETVLWPAHMAYWDGRLWMAATQDPAALHYSCDRVQCPFGIPEESFPDTNVLRIPAADGAVRGMRLIGEQLLVTTERWAYTIAGNNESNYRLVRVSTRMAGVGDYQMDEFVSDVEGGGPLVVFVGTDSKVYAMPLGGQAVHISKEIQTYLESSQLFVRETYQLVRVHCMSTAGRRMVLVYIPSFNRVTGKTFVYDFDQKVWTEHTLQNSTATTNTGVGVAWGTVSGLNVSSSEVYTIASLDIVPPLTGNKYIDVWDWFDVSWQKPIPNGYARTFPLTLDGKKTRKQIHFVRIYVNQQPGVTPPYTSWTCSIYKDSGNVAYTAAFGDELDDAYKMVGTNSVDTPGAEVGLGAKEQIVTGPQLTGGPPLIGYTFDIQVTFPSYTTKIYQLYRVDVGWTTVSEEDP